MGHQGSIFRPVPGASLPDIVSVRRWEFPTRNDGADDLLIGGSFCIVIGATGLKPCPDGRGVHVLLVFKDLQGLLPGFVGSHQVTDCHVCVAEQRQDTAPAPESLRVGGQVKGRGKGINGRTVVPGGVMNMPEAVPGIELTVLIAILPMQIYALPAVIAGQLVVT